MNSPARMRFLAGNPLGTCANWRLVSIAPAAFSYSQRDWKDAPAGVRRVPLRQPLQSPALGRCEPSHRREVMRQWPPKFWTGVTPMAFEPGMFVVCVDASIRMEWRNPHLTYDNAASLDGLVRGAVYTIAHYGSDGNHPQPMVWLEEISRPLGAGFDARRFRPRKDESLSVFRQALEPSPKQTEAA